MEKLYYSLFGEIMYKIPKSKEREEILETLDELYYSAISEINKLKNNKL